MQVQTAEVKVHTAHRCDLIVTDKTFCVNKSRRVLVNFYPALYERRIVGLREQKNHLLVRNSRRHNPYIHAVLRRIAERGQHLMVNDQIRCKNIDVILCPVYDIQINIFTHILMIQGTVAVRLHKPVVLKRSLLVLCRHKPAVIFRGMDDVIPHGQKHAGQTPDRLALDAHAGVLPVAEPSYLIDIFICQIDSARKTDRAVHHKNLPVIPVVHDYREQRPERIKCSALDALFLKLLIIPRWQCADAADIVVDQAHLHALLYLSLQNILDLVEHMSLLDDKIFQKNKVFRTLQRCKHIRKHRLPTLIILCGGIPADRKMSPVRNIF